MSARRRAFCGGDWRRAANRESGRKLRQHSSSPRVWITGASSGIGLALAQHALKNGARVAVSGRNRGALENINGGDGQTLVLPFDVRDGEAAQAAAESMREKWGGLDWAVLNAGDCEYVNPREQDEWGGAGGDAFSRMMEVNFLGAVRCAHAALPLLRQSRGLLAAVSSTAALCPLPRAAAYGSSKAALSYFTRALEPHFPEVDFCVVSPGFVKTPLTDRNDFPMPFITSAEDAAAIIWRGIKARRNEVIFPRRLSWLLRAVTLLPSPLRRKLWANMTRGENQ